jgi:dienelactone hydrolase
MYDALLAETVTITGHGGDQIEAYSARPMRSGPVGGVVVIHHLPGYDRQTKDHPLHGWPPIIEKVADLSCPLLGLFGAADQNPAPADVTELEEALKANGKTYEFHSYEGAGHAFLQVDRPSYRPEAAVDAWRRILAWYGRYLTAED